MNKRFHIKHIVMALLVALMAGGASCTRGIMLQDGEADYHELNDREDLDEFLLENAEIEQDDTDRY